MLQATEKLSITDRQYNLMVFLANLIFQVFKTIISFRHENHQSRVPPVGFFSIDPNLDHTMAGDTCFGVTLKDAPKPRPQKVNRRFFGNGAWKSRIWVCLIFWFET